jgi:hypothetical protein
MDIINDLQTEELLNTGDAKASRQQSDSNNILGRTLNLVDNILVNINNNTVNNSDKSAVNKKILNATNSIG